MSRSAAAAALHDSGTGTARAYPTHLPARRGEATPTAATSTGPLSPGQRRRRRVWRTVRPWLIALALLVVVGLIARFASDVDWSAVGNALAGYQLATLLVAAALAALGHLLLCSYDLLARHWLHHHLPVRRTMAVAFVSYASNLNLGSLVGGVALRFRLYSRFGLDTGRIARVWGFGLASNWLGYMLVAGLMFAGDWVALPADWTARLPGLRWFGVALLCGVAGYATLCWRYPGRRFLLRGHRIVLPSARVATLQVLLGAAHWLTVAALMHQLLRGTVPYVAVLGTALTAAVAGLIVRVPGGLGVLEATYLALLGDQLDHPTLIAALLAYRGLYYLGPLLAAAPTYLALEHHAGRLRSAARRAVAPRESTLGGSTDFI